MRTTLFGIVSVAAVGLAFAAPLAFGAGSTDLQSAFRATQGLSYEEIVERVNSGDGGAQMFLMVTDPRDVAVLGYSGNGFWHGRTNRPLPNAPQGYRVFGGTFGNYIWGLVADSQGHPISQAWFFGTRENGRFHIFNLFGNRANGIWYEL